MRERGIIAGSKREPGKWRPGNGASHMDTRRGSQRQDSRHGQAVRESNAKIIYTHAFAIKEPNPAFKQEKILCSNNITRVADRNV